jgi:hypothetical protein
MVVVKTPSEGKPSMGKPILNLSTVTRVFQVHAVEAKGEIVVTRKLTRSQLISFFAELPPCVVAMEACSSGRHWGRAPIELGHEVRLIPPAHVKPYVRRNNNDQVDAAVPHRPALVFNGRNIPSGWHVGGFEFEIEHLTAGQLDGAAGVLRGAAGKGWLHLPCARPPIHTVGMLQNSGVSHLTHAVQVVAEVLHPQTEIPLTLALQLRPEVALGDTISLDLAVDRADLQKIVELGRGVLDWLEADPHAGSFPVEFSDVCGAKPTNSPGAVLDRRRSVGRRRDAVANASINSSRAACAAAPGMLPERASIASQHIGEFS